MRRTFEVTLPSICWKQLLTVRFLVVLVACGILCGAFYWWKHVRPFFQVERASLCMSSMEVRSIESGRLLHCPFNEGDLFQRGQTLFSLDQNNPLDQLKEVDRKIVLCRQQIDQTKRKIDQNMEQYLYLQSELQLEGKTSEILGQILAEVQKIQGTYFQMEKELQALQNERAILEQGLNKNACIAEFEGMILRSFKQLGDAVVEGEPIFLIANIQHRWVEAEIPEQMLLKVATGAPVFIEFPSFPKKKWQGKVSWISSLAKEGKLKIRMSADQLPNYAGLTARACIEVR